MTPTPEQRACNSDTCGWIGTTGRMCGTVGPLCPECGETTEIQGAPLRTCMAQPAASAEPFGFVYQTAPDTYLFYPSQPPAIINSWRETAVYAAPVAAQAQPSGNAGELPVGEKIMAAFAERFRLAAGWQDIQGSWFTEGYMACHRAAQASGQAQDALTFEQRQAIKEGERNAATDSYFAARTWLMDTSDNRRIYEAGFDGGYDAARQESKGADQ